MKIAILPGDGIGPEIMNEAVRVLNALGENFEMEWADVGGAGYAAHGHPLPESTLKLAKEAEAISNTIRWNVPCVLNRRFWDCARI